MLFVIAKSPKLVPFRNVGAIREAYPMRDPLDPCLILLPSCPFMRSSSPAGQISHASIAQNK